MVYLRQVEAADDIHTWTTSISFLLSRSWYCSISYENMNAKSLSLPTSSCLLDYLTVTRKQITTSHIPWLRLVSQIYCSEQLWQYQIWISWNPRCWAKETMMTHWQCTLMLSTMWQHNMPYWKAFSFAICTYVYIYTLFFI